MESYQETKFFQPYNPCNHIGKNLCSNLTILHILRVQQTWDAKLLFSQLVGKSVVLKDVLWSGLKELELPPKDISQKIFDLAQVRRLTSRM